MMHQNSLEPAAIQFTLERLQESARRLGYFLFAFFMYLYPCDQECVKSVIVALSFYCTARLSMHTCRCSHLAV